MFKIQKTPSDNFKVIRIILNVLFKLLSSTDKSVFPAQITKSFLSTPFLVLSALQTPNSTSICIPVLIPYPFIKQTHKPHPISSSEVFQGANGPPNMLKHYRIALQQQIVRPQNLTLTI